MKIIRQTVVTITSVTTESGSISHPIENTVVPAENQSALPTKGLLPSSAPWPSAWNKIPYATTLASAMPAIAVHALSRWLRLKKKTINANAAIGKTTTRNPRLNIFFHGGAHHALANHHVEGSHPNWNQVSPLMICECPYENHHFIKFTSSTFTVSRER